MANNNATRAYKLMKSPKEVQRQIPISRIEIGDDPLKRFINEQLAKNKQLSQRKEKERVVLHDALKSV